MPPTLSDDDRPRANRALADAHHPLAARLADLDVEIGMDEFRGKG